MKVHYTTNENDYHYILDAAFLLDACRNRIYLIENTPSQGYKQSHPGLTTLDSSLESCENLVHEYLLLLLAREKLKREGKQLNGIDLSLEEICDRITRETPMSGLKKTAIQLKILSQMKNDSNKMNRNWKKTHPKYAEDSFPINQPKSKSKSAELPDSHNDPFFVHATDNEIETERIKRKNRRKSWKYENTTKHKYSQMNRSPEGSLIFNLVLALQLCFVRLEDADSNLCGPDKAKQRSHEHSLKSSNSLIHVDQIFNDKYLLLEKTVDIENDNIKVINDLQENNCELYQRQSSFWSHNYNKILALGALGVGSFMIGNSSQKSDAKEKESTLRYGIKALTTVCTAAVIRRRWMLLTMHARLRNSAAAIDLWQQKWIVHQSLPSYQNLMCGDQLNNKTAEMKDTDRMRAEPTAEKHSSSDLVNASAQRLIESISFQSAESSFWQSQGAMRFILLKRAMDLVYASIGTAIQVTGAESKSGMWMPVAAAAASYYAITGPDATASRVAQVMSSSSYDLIKRAWGMVSLPAVKRLSLEVSKLLKGAAIATRINIAGVPCFVISRNPYLPLSTAIKRFQRQQQREVSHLTTILEAPDNTSGQYPRRAFHIHDYPKKNVILHMTGGGFFAHTIAGDLPYLIDWSGHTNAIVICPEYALLPEHSYPVALNQITDIYISLVSGDSAPLLGFRLDRVIVTGESAGGNLAAALCVKLCLDNLEANGKIQTGENFVLSAQSSMISDCDDDDHDYDDDGSEGQYSQFQTNSGDKNHKRLPDAMMLCCPALNLSLSMSCSRVMGDNDPVLPSGLISAISDAYLPSSSQKEACKEDPLASPYFAPDSVLRYFPTTLLYASSADPLLDDSVHFNTRLRQLGVDSDLRAVHHMPHAYWGLGTAGFPEAQVVQSECQTWLANQFQK